MKWSEISKDEWNLWQEKVNSIIDESDFDISIFNNYVFWGNTDIESRNNDYLIYLQRVTVICNNNQAIKSQIFSFSSKITPDCVYQYAYYLANDILYHTKQFEELLYVASQIFSAISPETIIENPLYQDVKLGAMTEYEIYEILISVPVSVMLKLLNAIHAPHSVIQELKKSIINKNEDSFLQCVLHNNLTFEYILPYLYSLLLLAGLKYPTYISIASKDKNFNWELLEESKTPILQNDVQIQRLLTELKRGKGAFINYYNNLPQNTLYSSTCKNIHISTLFGSILSDACPDYNLVRQFNAIVESNELLKTIKEKYTTPKQLIEINHLEFGIPILEEFKCKYIADLVIPPSIGIKKEERMHFNGDRIWHNPEIIKLYRALVNAGFVSWDAETYFSFMYRMSMDYKPSREDSERMLTRIVWTGKLRDLLALAYYLHAGDTIIWKKCQTFFVDSDGSELNIPKGCINMAKSPTDRLENILKDKSFR